jgi:UDP-2,4-diacetamido-2,4,6-trideoxy-beta-L-altropyranose hydrolase
MRSGDDAPPLIALRCDGDESVGAGHVARCLPLAHAFRARGWRAELVGRFAGLAGWLVGQSGVPVREPRCEDAVAGLHPADGWAAAVVDTYSMTERELCSLADVLPLTTLAEARRCPGAGVVLDYHLDRAGEGVSDRLLPGPDYAPLDPRLVGARRERTAVRRVLVSVGGSAAPRELGQVIVEAVRSAFPNAHVVVASGISVDGAEELPFPAALVDQIRACDLAVSAAGLSAYELACAGVPSVVLAITDNQRRVVGAVREAHVALGLDVTSEPLEAIAAAVAELRDADLRTSLSAAGIQAFDGVGAARAAAMLERLWTAPDDWTPRRMILRAAGLADRDRLLAWRNDPLTRQFSFEQHEVDPEEHRLWFESRLASPNCQLWIAEVDRRPVGQVRIDSEDGRGVVSLAIAPDARGEGHATEALRMAVELAPRFGIGRLEAVVKPGNEASLHVFARAGFVEREADETAICLELGPAPQRE